MNKLESFLSKENKELYNLMIETNNLMRIKRNEAIKKANIKKAEKLSYINSQNSFTLYIQFHEKRSNNLYFEEIQLEGIENGMMVMDSYRKNGHDLGLHTLTLSVNDEQETKVHKINFKY